MAGIGFELQKLALRRGVFAPFGALGHGAVIAAGPWLFTILAIGCITLTTTNRLGQDTLAEFRVTLIYAFALSLAITAPIVIIATRMVADAIYTRRFKLVSSVFFAATAIAAGLAALITFGFYLFLFDFPQPLLLAATSTCTIVSMIWVAHAFCGAVRDYNGITIGFIAGLFVALAGASMVNQSQQSSISLIWTFNFGLVVTYAWLASRVLRTFPDAMTSPYHSLRWVGKAAQDYWLIGFSAFVAVTAIWIDKWIMWVGPLGERLPNGLLHAPTYDSAMFNAYLAIIPALSLFVVDIETTFFTRYQRFFNDIKEHATLDQIRDNAASLKKEVYRSLRRIFIVQASLCVIIILLSPLVIDMMNMQYRQAPVFRYGVLGALFQFIFLAASSLQLFFNRNLRFLLLQGLFLFLNTWLSYATTINDGEFYGFGYFLTAVLSSAAALWALERSLNELTLATFMSAASANRDSKWLPSS